MKKKVVGGRRRKKKKHDGEEDWVRKNPNFLTSLPFCTADMVLLVIN
jgi:hypothetical protein